MRHVTVVGASLAGLSAVRGLRESGFDGGITLIEREPELPPDRPPLSKQVLTGEWEVERATLPGADSLGGWDVELLLGVSATGYSLDDRRVRVSDGSRVAADGLVIATGAAPRRLPLPGMDLPGIHLLRTRADALALRADLDAGPSHVVVIGAGFIGAEVAASVAQRSGSGPGPRVTVLEAADHPLQRVFPAAIGERVVALHAAHGVRIRCGVGIVAARGTDRVAEIELAGGERIPADVVVVGVGVAPDTSWLVGSGLRLDDGVLCDATLLAAPGVVAAGDTARWAHPGESEPIRVEHWDNAIEQGVHAGRRLLVGTDEATPFAAVPWFWSDQYDSKWQLAGRVRPDDEMVVIDGDLAADRFVAAFGRDGRVSGVVSLNRPAPVMRWRMRLATGPVAFAEVSGAAQNPGEVR